MSRFRRRNTLYYHFRNSFLKYPGKNIAAHTRSSFQGFERIDFAISNAGVPDIGNWVDPDLGLEGIKQVRLTKGATKELCLSLAKIPNQRALDVNLLRTLYFARIAAVYLRQGQEKNIDRSMILMSSAAGIKEWPHMPVNQVRYLCYRT